MSRCHSLPMGLEEAASGVHVELVQSRAERGLALELGMDRCEDRSAGDEVMAETKLRGLSRCQRITRAEADDWRTVRDVEGRTDSP